MLPLPTIKRCTKCGEHKELTEFYTDKRWRAGLHSGCKACHAVTVRAIYDRNSDAYKETSRRWRAANPERVTENARRTTLRRYGLTPEQFERLAVNGCHVCGGSERLCVDHDHSTGQVRGVLCSNCNKCLGLLREDPERILSLSLYIRRYLGG